MMSKSLFKAICVRVYIHREGAFNTHTSTCAYIYESRI